MKDRSSVRALRIALIVALHGMLSSAALAHVQPIPIRDWGPFLPPTLHCLRMISRATHVCFDRVLAVEQQCQAAIVRGEACNREEVEAEIGEATRVLRTTLTGECAQGDLTEIGYFGFFDAEADLFSACVTQSRGAVSAAYAPTLAGPPAPAAASCIVASADYSRKVMRFALERETPVMERIATRQFTEAEKVAMVREVETELAGSRTRWITGLTAACPDFATVYGRSAETFLRTMKQRTDCVLSNTYVHSAITCLGQVCGNGIKETNEECDDGNRNEEDTCRSNCTANPP